MNEDTKKICELTERLIKREEPLPGPEPLSLVDPSEILSYLQLARKPIELLRNLREQLTKMGPVKIFNTRVKRKLIEIKKKKTPTDRIEIHLRVIHLLAATRAEHLPSSDKNLPKEFKRIRQDSQLKTALNECFGPLYAPGYGVDFDFDPLQNFMFDVRSDAYESTFKPEKYLDWAGEVMKIVNPEQYGKRSQSVGTPIVSQTVPSSLGRHLQRLKTCYLLGLDEMTIVFCRSVLEVALFGVLRQRGKLQGGGNVDDEFYPLVKLLGLTDRQVLGSEMQDRAHRIRLLAGDLLHNKGASEVTEKSSDTPPCLKELALASVKDTFDIVEALYG